MKHLFSIAVLMLAVYGRAFSDAASDKGELTQLVNDINVASSTPILLFSSASCTRTTSITATAGLSRTGQSIWRTARLAAWIMSC